MNQFNEGEVIDQKYEVLASCSSSGGMGEVLIVRSIVEPDSGHVALKFCRPDPRFRPRFNREVRVMLGFRGNPRVAEILDFNLDCEPPYYVMPFYEQGDLTKWQNEVAGDQARLENWFLQMIACVAELHREKKFHRDIKPQNFLVSDSGLVIADFGLSVELDSISGQTSSSESWGTPGYLPPEFLKPGGFKHADARSDIFMLGKAFYYMVTGVDPVFLTADGLDPGVFALIEKCCSVSPELRYQSTDELGQAVVNLFDVLLGRKPGPGRVRQLIAEIEQGLRESNKYAGSTVEELLDSISALSAEEARSLCMEIPGRFFGIFVQERFKERIGPFLRQYEHMVHAGNYTWSYAETIADNMKVLFAQAVHDQDRARALELAIHAAYHQNRFAAMSTCREMIRSVDEPGLGLRVADVLRKYPDSFVASVEPASCHDDLVATTLRELRQEESDQENGE